MLLHHELFISFVYDLKIKSKTEDPNIATFSDLEKAFNSIDHDLLLYCLLRYTERKVPLIESFLKTRSIGNK